MIEKLIRPNILRLAPYSCARDEFKGGNAETVFMDANESPFGDGLNRYPDPLQRNVKERLSELKGIPAEQIFLGNGSDEAIDLVFRVFCRPAVDNVIVLTPSYGMYEVCANINDVECRLVSLKEDYSFDADDVLSACDEKTKAVFLCSPNNPTGNLLPRREIEKVLETFQGITIIDEAYIDFCADATWRKHLQNYPRLIILSTFSKAWAAAGVRLGMAFASEEIIRLFNKVKYPYNVNILTQQKALEILSQPQKVEQEIALILSERKRLQQELQQLSIVKKIFPSDANFLLVRVENAPEIYRRLAESNLIVRNRHRVTLCQNCLRITIGKPEENDLLINYLQEISAL